MKKPDINPEILEEIFTMYKNVKYLREKHGLSIKQMADIMGISEKKLLLSETCTEAGCFYDRHVKNICDYFNVKADDLLTKELYKPGAPDQKP